MKKNYLVLLCSLFCVYSTTFSQARTNDHGDAQLPGTPGGVDYLGSCDTLRTTFAGGNGNDGAMFTLKAKQDIIIQNFEANLNGSGIMKIYFHPGSYVGFENNPLAWTLIDSAFTTSAGANVPTLIPVQINMEVDSGELVSFYVTGNVSGADVNYTDGTTEGAIYSSNADLEIYEGQGMTYPFGGNFTPRIWNGRINYCPNINYCDELTTTFTGGNGNDGVVFEVANLQDAVIRTFDVSLFDSGYVYIYYKLGPYAGTTTTPGAWTLADSAFVGSAGVNVPTEIPIDLNLYIPQGQLYSFLITGNGVDGQSITYSNGVAIGATFIADNTLQVREGEGFAAPWGGANGLPRVFNGTIHYCNPGADTAIVCQNLFTTNAAGNSNSGIMFDVDAKQDAVEIQSFDTYFTNSGPQEVRVYYKNGTHVGFETNAAAWTLVDSISVNSPAAGALVHIPIPVNVQIAPNAKMAFFIYSAIADIMYTDGVGITVPDTVFNEDSFIKFHEGTGKTQIFTGANFNPRVFNGRINYCYLESWVGIEENSQLTGLEIWPNPTQGIFTISAFNTQENIAEIEVLNLNGQVVRQWTTLGGNSFSADISNEPAGVYLVKTRTQTATYTQKIILTGQ
jgi:hypothetical protein